MFNTGNPIGQNGSNDPRDLSDNARIADVIVNDTERLEVPSRTGKMLKTRAGMEQMVVDYLAAQGFEAVHLQYVTGQPLAVLRPTQLIDHDGSVYKVKMPASFPFNLSGNWAVDAPRLTDVGDAALRQALAAPTGASLIGTESGDPLSEVLKSLESARSGMLSVESFGIYPDGTTNWESSPLVDWAGFWEAAKTVGVLWPAGYYACGLNFTSARSGSKMHFEPGSILGGVFHLISDAAVHTQTISSIARASNVVSVTTATPHNKASGARVQILSVTSPSGSGAVSFNGETAEITVTSPTTFTYPQVGPDATGTLTAGSIVTPPPLKDVFITGLLTTTDRLGTINCKDCYIESCWVMNDPSRHSGAPGRPARGAHIYIGTDGLVVGDLVIDYASGDNTTAAFSVDGFGWNPSRCKFGRVHLKDSAYTGVYLTGGGHWIGEMRIDGFAKEVPPAVNAQDANSVEQTQQLKGLWTNRCWDTRIDTLYTSQRIEEGTRSYERHQVMIDQTGHPFYGTSNSGISIGAWYAENVRRHGIAFGDPAFDSVSCNVAIGLMEVRSRVGDINKAFVGATVNCFGASGRSSVSIDTLRFIDPADNKCVYVETTGKLIARNVEALGHYGQILNSRGYSKVDRIYGYSSASAVTTDPLIQIQNPASNGSHIGDIVMESSQVKAGRVFQAGPFSASWGVDSIRSTNYRDSVATVYVDAPSASWQIRGLFLTGGGAGNGLGFNGACTLGHVGPSRITGFALGVSKGAATFSNNTAIGVIVSGNTVQTDLPAAAFEKLGCLGLTLQ